MACEDCLEVCFVGLVVERICVWCLAIAAIFVGFGQAGAKMCGGCLKVINWGWRWKGALFIGKAGSHYVILLLWIFNASFTGYILWKVLLDTSFHYTTVVLRVWGWQSQKCNSECPNPMSFWYKHPYPYSLARIHLLQLKMHIWMESFGNQKFLCIFQ